MFVYRGVWAVGYGKHYLLPFNELTYWFVIMAMCGDSFGRQSTFSKQLVLRENP